MFAALVRFGPLVALFARYPALFGALEALGVVALAYVSLQIPPYRREPFTWPQFVNKACFVTAYIAVTYQFEVRLFPALPSPDWVTLLIFLSMLLALPGMPGRMLTWINRRIRGGHIPQAPANPA